MPNRNSTYTLNSHAAALALSRDLYARDRALYAQGLSTGALHYDIVELVQSF